MEKLRINIRTVFYREADVWVAHCLELDVCGHAKSRGKALEKMLEAVAMQLAASLKHNNRSNIFMPADAKFFQMFAAGTNIAEGEMSLEVIKKATSQKTGGRLLDIETVESREFVCA